MRKVYIEMKVKIVVNANEDVDIGQVVQECDYNFLSQTIGADIVDTEILDWEITDSK